MSGARPIHYIQLYNQQHDPVFMELSTGKLHWTLSNENLLTNIIFVSHISDEGKFYYENVDTNVVQWDLPKERMSIGAVDVAELVIKINRKMLEKRVGSPYDLDKSNQQMLALDNYLRNKDALKEQSTSGGVATSNSFLAAALDDDDEEENERYDSVGPMKTSNNPFLAGGGSSDEEDDRSTFARNTFSDRASRSSSSSLKTTDMLKRATLKSGYLMKLATVSGRNWKKRFFTLTPYYLAYYEDEKSGNNSTKKPKGELQILPDGTVSEEKVDKKYGFGFRYTNSVESIVLAASTDIDRAHWMQTIESLIQQSSHYLKAFLTILPFSTVFLNNQLKNYFGSNNKTPARKYVILTDEILSVHPDKSNLTTIDGIININDLTRIECTESNGNYIISITDSDTKNSKLSIQFNSGIDDEKYYKIWKTRLQQLIYGGEVSLPAQQPQTRSSSSSAAPRSSLKQAPPPPAPAPAPAAKQAIPNNVSVFGLSLDDDDDDEDVDISAVASTTNVPFKAPAAPPIADSYPSPEAKSNASTTSATTSPTATAKRPSKPMGKSFLKMRAKSQSKERSSVTENPAPVIPEVTSKSSNNPALGGGVTAGVFGLSLDDDDEEDNVTPSFTNPASFSNPTLTAATTAPPPPPPPSKKGEAGANESFNPITASRRRSVNQPSAALPPSNSSSESLFLQSLKSKNDAPAAVSNSYDDYDNNSIGGGSNKPPPPPPPKKGVQNYEDPHSLHDFQQSNQYEQQQPQATENIFNTRKKTSLTPFGGGSTNAPPVSTFNVNALDYGQVEVKPGEYEDGNITFESLRGGTGDSNRRRSSVKRNSVSGGGSVNSRQISDLSLQEYLTTPIELRSSKLLDDVFAKPTEDFLHQTNQILHESKEKLKQLLQDNQSLLPHLSKTKSILQENKKSSFSLEKIEEYLQAHSIFNHYNNNGHQNSAYQQLLQEKEIILNLLQFMKLSEKNMIDTIQLYEMEALQRIENETNFYKNELKQLENEMKQLHQEHYQQIAEQTRVMELSKVLLVEKTQQANLSYQENIEQLIYLAKDLHTQQQQVNVERKKMLKQRYQLDVLLQEMNDVTYQPQQHTSQMNNNLGMSMGMNSMGSMNNLHAMNGMNNGMMNPAMPMMPMMNYSHDSMMSQPQQHQYAPNLNNSMNNNMNMMMQNPGMNNPMMQQQQQIPLRSNTNNFNNNQMMMNGNGNQSPMMMQELFNMSGGFPSQNSPNTASSFNSSNILRGGAGSSGLPSRSVSPSGNRYMVGGNMAGSMQYNNGATAMRGTSPHGLAGVFPSTNEFPLPEETANNNPNILMHADEMMDYRVGRSRAVQNNNINSVGSRARSRSPSGSQSSTIQSAPQLRGGINNMSLTKQHLQLLQQQQGVGGNNGGNLSRGTSPSPYYMGPPAHVNNIQVNLEQLKKHTMNNNNRKPFK